jgi:hypothetical protein
MSTIQVDRITPFQSSSVTVEGLFAPDLATTGSNTFEGDQIINGTITASLEEGYVWVGDNTGKTVTVSTASFGGGGGDTTELNEYTASNDTKWSTLGGETGSYARTNASNNFSDVNQFNSTSSFFNTVKLNNSIFGESNHITLNVASSSLTLASPASSDGITGLAHLQSSDPSQQVNLMFKNNNIQGTTIISGSNNIFSNPQFAPLAGFNYYIGSRNILAGTELPSIVQSMEFSPTMFANIGSSTIRVRGPVSASAMSISNNYLGAAIFIGQTAVLNAEKLTGITNVNSNILAGNLSLIANQTDLTGSVATGMNVTNNITTAATTLIMSSSAVLFTQNYVGGLTTVRNEFFSQSLGLGRPQIAQNQFVGSNTVELRGEQIAGTSNLVAVNGNTVGGAGNILYPNTETPQVVGVNAYNGLLRNFIFGSNLVITGSSLLTDIATLGSAFLGRFGIDDGIRNRTSDTVFSVGTGTSTTVRKTGLRIDSGSNTFVEGTLNVSGSTSTTGSITIQSGSGDLFVHGNKQFNVGAFSSLVTQSGSANVSQSVTFDTTDKSDGVSVASNSQITFANSGTYSITFSAQILADGGQDTVRLWLKKNGTNVPNTTTKLIAKNGEETVMTVNYVVDAIANDYYEVVFETVSGDGTLLFEPASGNYPAVPSIILTAVQVR